MTLRITSIDAPGNLDAERLIMRAGEELDVGKFAIFCANVTQTGVGSGNIPAAYWFMDYKVAANDWVVLYTKAGSQSKKNGDSGPTSHFFYWSRQAPLWTPRTRPVIVYTSPYAFGPLTP